ncbi:MAG: TRAP transporter small permease subunit [Celeribacter sp.]|jgi:C4-dicarboxylate transporter DctQ subunit
MQTPIRWIVRIVEALTAAALFALFTTFLIQIFSRYVLGGAVGWTIELNLTLWIWIVFIGAAFIVRDRDHVTFDILYLAVPDGPRKVFALISAAAIAGGLLYSLLPTWDYIDFLKIKRSATLGVPLRTIFSCYAIFLVVVSLRYIWVFVSTLRHGASKEAHEIHVGED